MNALAEAPARAAAAPTEPEAAADRAVDTPVADRQFVAFSVAGETFAVPMAPVQEIIRVPEVARLPLAPASLDGLANLRGRVLPIVNLRRIFGVDERAHDDSTRALVIHIGQPLGFVVDRVASVMNVDAAEIEPATAIRSVVQSDYLTGVIRREGAGGDAELLMVLDFERLVREQFDAVGGAAGRREALAGSAGRGAGVAAADEGATTADELRLVSFTVGGQEYAIDIAAVQEIVQVPEQVTAVPGAPSHVLGMISLRRRLLPLVSLRGLFRLGATAREEHHRVVVVALPDGGLVGLVTDAVKEVLTVPRSQVTAMPEVLARDGQLDELESICRLDEGRRLVSIIATDRLLGLAEIREAAATAAQSGDPMNATATAAATQAADDDTQVVIFRLGAEEFGVPIMSVQEIVRVPEVLTRVPRTPAFVEGVINLRGTVLPVIDQRKRLGLEAIERNDRQRIMVYTLGGTRTGFIVDSVAEVLRIPRAAIEPAPDLGERDGPLISQVAKLDGDGRLVMLIDPQLLLGARDFAALDESLAGAAAALPPLAQAA